MAEAIKINCMGCGKVARRHRNPLYNVLTKEFDSPFCLKCKRLALEAGTHKKKEPPWETDPDEIRELENTVCPLKTQAKIALAATTLIMPDYQNFLHAIPEEVICYLGENGFLDIDLMILTPKGRREALSAIVQIDWV